MKKDHQDRESPADDDPEYIILGKIYSELDATVDLASIARNRTTLSHLLPFLLNALLYGFNDTLNTTTTGSAITSGTGIFYGSSSNRSAKKSSNFRVNRDPNKITLGGTTHLVKQQCERQLEQFLYQQAMNSVQFALECVWYLTTSLSMGPKESYHRTMTLLLGMESVVATLAPPGDLFKKAAVKETPSRELNTEPNTENTRIIASITNRTNTSDETTTTTATNTTTTTTAASSSSSPTSPVAAAIPPSVASPSMPDRLEDHEINRLVSRRTFREVDLDITGSGENDHRMQFNAPLKGADEAKLERWLEARRERANVFHAQLDFVKCLTHISQELFLVEREYRRDVLRRELEKLNDFIPKNVFIPTERRAHRVLRIVPDSAHVFSTKERVPYLLVLEVEDLGPPPPSLAASADHANSLQHSPNSGASHSLPDVPDDSARTGPLRRIGSIGASTHSNLHANKFGRNKSAIGSGPNEDDDSIGMALQNKPESKFEFSPDVTAEVNRQHHGRASASLMESSGGDGTLIKRESSFRVADGAQVEDRRPPDEELLKVLGDDWPVKSERIRKESPFGSKPTWRLVSCIVKARDQLRQEMFAQRLIQEFARIFESAGIPVWLRAYQIISTGHDSGLIETVTDALSIDSIKKQNKKIATLQDYFFGRFGGRGTQGYKRAVRNFVQSMAGYSIVQYLLNIKDRHNGNLMIDAEGHLLHVDFGFLLSNSPGGNMEFEKAPFKLTNEMVQVMGGTKSSAFKLFKKLCVQGYQEACRYANKILLMVDIMYPGNESMPCFLQGREYVLENLRERFSVDLTRKERSLKFLRLIQTAHGNWTTKAYDQFQKVSLGIAK